MRRMKAEYMIGGGKAIPLLRISDKPWMNE
jgi:hypothetical protein